MKLKNSNGFLTRVEMGGRKRFYKYIFLKKYLKGCSTVIIQNNTVAINNNTVAIKPAKQVLKNPYCLMF